MAVFHKYSKKEKIFWIILALIALSFLLIFDLIKFPDPDFKSAYSGALIITDRNGVPLRAISSDEGDRDRNVSISEISPYFIKALIAIEDKRFYYHKGIDPYAICRAIYKDIKNHSNVEGASTLSQQLAQMLFPIQQNSWSGKVYKMYLAVKLELHLSKSRILELYSNNAPFGNNLYGIYAASESYFRRPPAELSLAQAAMLAGLVQNPAIYCPHSNYAAAVAREKLILHEMYSQKMISEDQLRRAVAEKVEIFPPDSYFEAPHFCDYLLSLFPKASRNHFYKFRSTIDLSLQHKAERLFKKHLLPLQNRMVTNGAFVILDNKTGDVLAMSGSIDYSSKDGQVNGAISPRAGGSILKPFTYALAIDDGMNGSDIIPDLPLNIVQNGGIFSPENYDKTTHGPVTLRRALACSYNIPAVKILQRVGVENLYLKLHEAGMCYLTDTPEHYGLGLTLGDGSVSLLQLTSAYSNFSSNGESLQPRFVLEVEDRDGKVVFKAPEPQRKRLFSPQVAYIIFDILSDNTARMPAFGANSYLKLPFPCAVKTGTSKSFRDNWCVGTTTDYTVAVWVGNFDNSSMENISGVTGAAPIFNSLMRLVSVKYPEAPQVPEGVIEAKVCQLSGKVPCRWCGNDVYDELYIKGHEPKEKCDVHKLLFVDPNTLQLLPERSHSPNGVYKLFKILPPIYSHWMAEHHIYLPRGYRYSDSSCRDAFSILYPENGSEYTMDPILRAKYQVLRFQAISPDTHSKVEWYLNNKKIAETRGVNEFKWQLRRGRFILRAVQNGKLSESNFVVY